LKLQLWGRSTLFERTGLVNQYVGCGGKGEEASKPD